MKEGRYAKKRSLIGEEAFLQEGELNDDQGQ